jgi:hypothetical protein
MLNRYYLPTDLNCCSSLILVLWITSKILIAGVSFFVNFQAYLQKLVLLEKQPHFYTVAVRCMCALLDTAPHFNFRENLLASVVKNLSSSDDVVR